jgi:superfamily II DNA or RNA helicase
MPYGIYDKVSCKHGKHPPFYPQEHQANVTDYFLNKLKYKGLLLYHRLGSGKSCSSIMVSDAMIKESKVKKVYVITPGSLRQNFFDEYCDKCGTSPEYLKKYYTFITSNYSVGDRLPDFNGSLVIIDEIHNILNGVKNQSKHSTLIYNSLMKANCKILALTGTPVYNNIWEWPLLGNLLKPDTFADIIKNGELDIESFTKQFNIDKDGNVQPLNPKMFDVKIHGIISYFPGNVGDMPEVIHEDPILIPMTLPQEDKYWEAHVFESGFRSQGPPSTALLRTNPKKYVDKMKAYIIATKWITTRFYSNFWYPNGIRAKIPEARDEVTHIGTISNYTYKPTGEISTSKKHFTNKIYNEYKQKLIEKGKWPSTCKEQKQVSKKIKEKAVAKVKKNVVKTSHTQEIGWINKKSIDNQRLNDVFSRKIAAFITNVLSNWKSKHVLFTFFKTKGGVNLIHALFKLCGIKTEIYSGDVSDGKRKKILDVFNSENNRYGDKIKILLVTEAGAEGINILETQHMHILESSTREMKIQQAIGRVVRYRSHNVQGRKPMPKNEQVVHIWRYWSVSSLSLIPKKIEIKFKKSDGSVDIIKKEIVEKTTCDEILYNNGRLAVNSMQSFLNILKNASVTPWDKSADRGGTLKYYENIKAKPEVVEACLLSDKRYLDIWKEKYEKKSATIYYVDHINLDEDVDEDVDEEEEKCDF